MLTTCKHENALNADFQVTLVKYSDGENLKYALRGIDTIISTVTGENQVKLVKAAVQARVRRFAPAEFEGPSQLRRSDDPLDRGRAAARQWLQHYQQHIQTTVFVCGILYERFQPGGLRQSGIAATSYFSNEGDYILDSRQMTAQVPAYDTRDQGTVTICMTAAQDVARFVTKALDLESWPAELRMCGERIRVTDLFALVQDLRGEHPLHPSTSSHRLFTPRQVRTSIRSNGTIQAHSRASSMLRLLLETYHARLAHVRFLLRQPGNTTSKMQT